MQINKKNRDTNTHRYLPLSIFKKNKESGLISLYDYIVGSLRDNNCCLSAQGDNIPSILIPQNVFVDDFYKGRNDYIDLYAAVAGILQEECSCSTTIVRAMTDLAPLKKLYLSNNVSVPEATSLKKSTNSTSPHQVLNSLIHQRLSVPNNPIDLKAAIKNIGDLINCCNPIVTTTFTRVCVVSQFDRNCEGGNDLTTVFTKLCIVSNFSKSC